MNVQGVLFCCDESIVFVPDNREPEEYAGFIGNNERAYITRHANLSREARETINAVESITIVERMNFYL